MTNPETTPRDLMTDDGPPAPIDVLVHPRPLPEAAKQLRQPAGWVAERA